METGRQGERFTTALVLQSGKQDRFSERNSCTLSVTTTTFDKKDLTEGSLIKHLFGLGLPVMLGMIMHNLYSLTDIFWVGKIGSTEVAAVSLCSLLFFVVFAVSQGFGSGTLAIVSRLFGQKKEEKAADSVRNAVFISLLTGAVMSILTFIYSKQVCVLIGADNAMLGPANDYLRPFCIGFMFQMLSMTVNFAIRGTGNMTLPVMLMVMSTVFNIVLDPCLIFGWGPFPEMGVAGAGLATTISQFLAAAFAMFALAFGLTPLRVRFTLKFRPDWNEIWTILKIGMPVGLQFLLLSMSFFILLRVVAEYGDVTVAAIGISWRIMHTSSIPVIGLGAAVATIVGQNLGAGERDRAHNATMKGIMISIVMSGCIAFSYFMYPDAVMKIFTNDADVIAIGHSALKLLAVSQIFISVSLIFQHCLSGAGDTFPTMFSAILRSVALIILALTLPALTGLGVIAIIIAMPCSTFTGMMVLLLYYRTMKWQTRMDLLEARKNAPGIIVVE